MRTTIITIATAAFILAASNCCQAQEVTYETLYDDEGIEFVISGELNRQVRQVSLHGQLGKEGMLKLDGNLCNVDQFGERAVCTLIFFRPFLVELPLIAAEGEWKLYGIVPKDARIRNFTLRLAVRKGHEATANLLLNSAFAPDVILETRMMRRVKTSTGYEKAFAEELAKDDKRQGKTHVVTMSGLSFSPRVLPIKAGDSVVWKCTSGDHNAESSKAPKFCTEPANRECIDCQNEDCLLKPGESSKPIRFNQTGSFDYFCRPHKNLGMTGTIVVQ